MSEPTPSHDNEHHDADAAKVARVAFFVTLVAAILFVGSAIYFVIAPA